LCPIDGHGPNENVRVQLSIESAKKLGVRVAEAVILLAQK
jgi:hypothetical protein